jgi:hypothetical protein
MSWVFIFKNFPLLICQDRCETAAITLIASAMHIPANNSLSPKETSRIN